VAKLPNLVAMFHLPSPLEKLHHPLLDDHRVNLFIKRDDLIHSEVSGNKWRKLKYNIEELRRLGFEKLLTFGGAYSNHIAATAAAANYFGIPSVGVIRGEELHEKSNPTLSKAHSYGMEFQFVSRQQYRKLREADTCVVYPDHYVIPEGGANTLGIKGVAAIISEIDRSFDTIITAVGTGTTLAGLVKGLNGQGRALGISVLKGDFLHAEVTELLRTEEVDYSNFEISETYHFGGYGKTTAALIDLVNMIFDDLGIKLDPIYTGKAFFGVWDMIERGKFDDQTLIFLHTGGLQGIAGYNQKNPQKIHY
jgi:1-aminocyclopropane-1-carboxylate deaminase